MNARIIGVNPFASLDVIAKQIATPILKTEDRAMRPYTSSAAEKFAPNNFVTECTSDKVGVTLKIDDPTDANPRVLVRWLSDLAVEWVRAEYLYPAQSV